MRRPGTGFPRGDEARLDPRIPLQAQGGRRLAVIGDPHNRATGHSHLEQVLEDEVVGKAGPVASPRMRRWRSWRQHRGGLFPAGWQERQWQRRQTFAGHAG